MGGFIYIEKRGHDFVAWKNRPGQEFLELHVSRAGQGILVLCGAVLSPFLCVILLPVDCLSECGQSFPSAGEQPALSVKVQVLKSVGRLKELVSEIL